MMRDILRQRARRHRDAPVGNGATESTMNGYGVAGLRLPLTGLATVLCIVIATVSYARVTRLTPLAMPVETPSKSIDLRFVDEPGGVVAVLDARDGRVVAQVAAGTGGFVRAVLQGLVRVRTLAGIGKEPPFRLERAGDGHLSLVDPATDRRVELIGFGDTNIAGFARFLPDGG